MRHEEVVLPYSKFKHSLAALLEKQGRISRVEVAEDNHAKSLKLVLKYDDTGEPLIEGLQRVSRPGQRIYAKVLKIPKVKLGSHGITVVSTSKGLMTHEQARAEKIGGEVICQIW